METPRESIFVTSLRSFCKAFAVIIGIFLAFVPVMLVISMLNSDKDYMDKTTLQILPDLDGNIRHTVENSPTVLRINVKGVIGEPSLTSEIIERELIDSRHGALKGDRVKAILLHIDSPGGTVKDSDGIYNHIKRYKKRFGVPVYAYVDGLCASGGMYIAAAADKVYSSSISVIGSVGVILGPFFNVHDTLTKYGIQAQTITAGKDKDMMSPIRQWKPDEDASLRAVTSYLYNQFVEVVSSNRPKLTRERLTNDLGARVYNAEEAEQLGYIDNGNSNYYEALQDLMIAADIDPNSSYQVIELEPKRSIFADLIQGKSPIFNGKIDHIHHLGSKNAHAIQDQFAYLYKPGSNNP